jgi:pimeloyl-ACP methyl ester carboxylesterase
MIDVGGYSASTPSICRSPTVQTCLHWCSFTAPAAICAIRWCRSGLLEGRAEMLFIDRPGHGWSERGGNGKPDPDGQATAIARAMQAKGHFTGHRHRPSFGGAIAASFALDHPDMTAGLVFLAPATHPWPGGISWYYDLTRSGDRAIVCLYAGAAGRIDPA